MKGQAMKENNLLENIKNTCRGCKECDPCCINYILKKCLENKRYSGIIDYKITSNANAA